MGRKLGLCAFIVITLLFAGACATKKIQTETDRVQMEKEGEAVSDLVYVRPGGSYEECLELVPGKVMSYRFTSSEAVNFNVHYHAEDEIKYSVNEKHIKGHTGIIDPESHGFFTADQEFYCLMWDNLTEESVRISFECIVKEKK